MTVYQYSSVQGTSISFSPATDQLSFNSGSASGLVFTTVGANLQVFHPNFSQPVTLLSTLYTQLLSNNMVFTDGSVFLVGTSGNNTLSGSAQGDYIDAGSAGTDVLSGLAGDDVFVLGAGLDATDQISGGSAGLDEVRLSGNYASVITLGANTITGVELVTFGDGGVVRLKLNNGMYTGLSGTVAFVGSQSGSAAGVELDGSSVTVATVQAEGGAAADILIGGSQGDLLVGYGGNDTLNGGAGSDSMTGGTGNDTYVVDNASDGVTESAGEGTDTVQSSISYTLGSDLENLTLTGVAVINGTGNTLNNTLTGNSASNTLTGGDGNDVLDGGAGNDTLVGGLGDDDYTVDSASDVITEIAGQGLDEVTSTVAYTLGANLENLYLSGSGTTTGTGNGLDNVLVGSGTGNNVLNGGGGNDQLSDFGGTDTLAGGIGDDIYTIYFATQTVVENVGEGTDRVFAQFNNYTLTANVENLTLGSTATNGTGNTLGNSITGNSSANLIDGGAGNDTMSGLGGNDTYVVDSSSDVINEVAAAGTDSVQASANYTLGSEVENLTLTGSAGLTGSGNGSANVITGNSGNNTLNGAGGNDTLNGGAGTDMLDGGLGDDAMTGGLGDDTYFIDSALDTVTENSGEGTDEVRSVISYTLGANLENLTLTGAASVNATGNTLNNTLTGNSGNNTLDGGLGNDAMVGGTGNDIYVLNSAGDTVFENAAAGTDTVQVGFSYTLGANVENLTLTGAAAINGTGNTINNILTGNSANNTLNGGLGNDTAVGGAGDDTYVVDSASDVVTELAAQGSDLVQSSVTYTLSVNVEALTLTGTAAIDGTGNSEDNTVTGNSGDNLLYGGGGNDLIVGGGGTDLMFGGAGNDTFVIDSALDNANENAGEGIDLVQSSISHSLNSDIENLTLTGIASIDAGGNALDNILIGNIGNNGLDGAAGNDTMAGGAGNDSYTVDSAGDVVTENAGEGSDTVQAIVSHTLAANVEILVMFAGTNGTGNALDNELYGNGSNNLLDGAAGNDLMYGGAGDDSYVVDSVLDNVGEGVSEGVDLVQASVSFTLGDNIENLTLTGSAAINATGNALNNVLTGNSGNNLLDGGAGNDTMAGGAGADTYTVDSSSDVVTESFGSGNDTVASSVSFTLAANIENLTLTGSAAINATGNTANNILTGNSGNNLIDGGTGNDTMSGGDGDDTFVVDSSTDSVDGGIGTDLVQASATFTLGSTTENLTLTGIAAINGTGNSLNNVLTGNSANNTLSAAGGNDTLNGGAGVDTMLGGLGNDTYTVDNSSDVVSEAAGEGTDLVQSSASFTLGSNVENLTLTGSGGITGTGNALDNVLIGNTGINTLNGGNGNDTLDGGANADTMVGGAGDDTYVVTGASDVVTEAAGEGTDLVQSSVTYTLSANVENMTLTGVSAINATGNSLNNVLTGNSSNNILDGGAGNDTMAGGAGADTYVVDSASDSVTEVFGAGNDTVQSSISYTLGSNVENLTLTGAAAINATGNTVSNTLTGNSGNNTLDGGVGDDAMAGGAGSDTYVVDSALDVITENVGEGTDFVLSSVSFTLGSNVEDLALSGASAINGTGNALNNVLIGGSGNNILDGAGGADMMSGSLGDDTYIVDSAIDVVTEGVGEGTDQVQSSASSFTLGNNIESLTLTGVANINGTGNAQDNVLTGNSGNNILDGGAGDDTMVGGTGDDTYVVDSAADVVTESAGEGADLVQSGFSYTLGADLENLTLTGGAAIDATGNAANNILTGNSGNNILDGGAGDDAMAGGASDDTYIVDSAADTAIENVGEGTDLVLASTSFTLGANVENLTLTGSLNIDGTGNSLANVITGNSDSNTLSGGDGNDTLDGGSGNDAMAGGADDDSYIVDSFFDIVTEAVGEGTDLVQSSITYTLDTNIENLTLTGAAAIDATGNAAANILTGNSASNTLDGGADDDTMAGGAGDDTYVVDSTSDTVIENVGEGTDLVQASATFTLGADIENLTLTGSAAIHGTGNSLANVITGNDDDNTLDGGGGDDTMVGGDGDDAYVVDSAADTVTENVGEGADLVQASVSFTLGDNLDNLTLTGSAAIDGTGNSLSNTLTGNNGNNALGGGDGNDTLNGGDGNDTLDGGAGDDAMAGGTGDDSYTVDSVLDGVTEANDEGTDLVQSSVTFTLSADVENLTLTGSAAINGTGNALNNVLTGNSGVNMLNGGAGDDTYVINNAGDTVIEAVGEGTDLVQSSVTHTLGAEVENLTLTGAAAINGTGNGLANELTGNSGNNILNGGVGADTMAGGAGNDTYVVDDVADAVAEAASEGTDLVQASATFTLGADIENLTLTGTSAISGTGNGLANVITGNSQNNTLTGGAGNDTLFGSGGTDILVGGADDDSYTVNSTGDVVTEAVGEGTDAVFSDIAWTLANNIENLTLTGIRNVSITGNALANVLTGNSGNNTLNGGAGADTMAGGGGGDTYVVDDAGDVITEAVGAGTDSVQSGISHTLAANVDNLTLTGASAIDGTGNALNNILNGNSAANTLTGDAGADTLNGGAGVDTLIGGLGNDTYLVDNTSTDVITENVGEGNDVVRANVSYVLGTNLENLVLVGTSNFNATGNTANNVITGNSGNNNLNGGAGRDTLNGGLGADRFVFSAATDTAADAQRDVISDFLSADGDKVNLAAIDAVAALGGDQAFTFIGTAAFSGTDASGQLRFSGGILFGSTDADSAAEFSIGLTGVVSMVAGDFIL